MFKTAGKYGFDSLFLTDTSMQVLDGYIDHIRPNLKPTCDHVLVTRNGGKHNKLGELMSKLVFDAIGKYVHHTRYRQIMETASSKKLSSTAEGMISENRSERGSELEMDLRSDFQTNPRPCLKKKKITMARLPRKTTFSLRPLSSKARMLQERPILWDEGKFWLSCSCY